MPLFRKWNYDGAACGIWKVTESIEQLRSLLTDKSFTSDEYDNYKSVSRQIEYLAVRVLLKELLGDERIIMHYATGRPYIHGYADKISISHTKGYVAVAVHPVKEIGIDIEYFSVRVKKVVPRFVNGSEANILDGKLRLYSDSTLKETMEVYLYLLIWSAKETIFKMIDNSEVDFVKHLHINSIHIPYAEVYAMTDSFSFNGMMKACESKTNTNYKMLIEFYACSDFVCTYSCLD